MKHETLSHLAINDFIHKFISAEIGFEPGAILWQP
jgi:hypothetical protein